MVVVIFEIFLQQYCLKICFISKNTQEYTNEASHSRLVCLHPEYFPGNSRRISYQLPLVGNNVPSRDSHKVMTGLISKFS